jgi:hypothetical protein
MPQNQRNNHLRNEKILPAARRAFLYKSKKKSIKIRLQPTKNIYFTVTNDLSYDQRMQRICSTLAAAGWRVVLVGRTLPQSVPLTSQHFEQVRLQCLYHKSKWFYIEYNLRLFFYLMIQGIKNNHKNTQNIFCACDLDTLLPSFFATKLLKNKLVYDAHEIFTEVPELIHRPRTQKIWLYIEKRTLPRLSHAYTVNQSLAHYYKKKYGVDFAVIRNLPLHHKKNNETTHPNTLQNSEDLFENLPKKFILYQGAVNLGRGLPQLIAAMPHVHLPLVIAGGGDIFIDLKQKVQTMALHNKVFFLGFVPPQQLHTLTQRAYVGINLLENMGLNSYYSLANKFLDYIQAARPQVCSNFVEYAQINAEHKVAILVNDLQPTTLANALNNLSENAALYASLQKNCTIAADALCWERESVKLLDFYKKL